MTRLTLPMDYKGSQLRSLAELIKGASIVRATEIVSNPLRLNIYHHYVICGTLYLVSIEDDLLEIYNLVGGYLKHELLVVQGIYTNRSGSRY